MADYKIEELMDMVQVKNRIVDSPVKIVFDGKLITWAPGQVLGMPKALADWFVRKSLYLFTPGDSNYETPAVYHYKLCIVGQGDNTDLTIAKVAETKELLDASNMPELTRVDPATGKPMRRVYIDPRQTGANTRAADAAERAATKKVTSAIVKAAAEEIADAAAGASEAEVEQAVAELGQTRAGA